jgi:Flp pilus assembly protein TadD
MQTHFFNARLVRGTLCLFVVCAEINFLGCRTIRRTMPDGHLVRGRQMSLRGADLLRRSRYDDAQALFCEAIRSCPTDERAHWGYATTLWENGRRPEAIEHMREAVRLSGNNPEYVVRLGEMYLAEGHLQSAAEQASEVLKSHRDRADAWALLGDSQMRNNEWDKSLESYHRALLLRPDYPEVQLNVAQTYRQLGRPNRALATLDRMIDMHPTSPKSGEIQVARASTLIDLDRNEEAKSTLALVGDSLPLTTPDRQLELVGCYCRLGELVEARMALGRLLPSFPSHSEVLAYQNRLDNSFAQLAEVRSSELQR